MNKISFAFLLSVFIGLANDVTLGMYAYCFKHPGTKLNEIEEQIFSREVERVGIESISEKLTQLDESSTDLASHPFIISLTFPRTDIDKDALAKCIFDTITEQEKKEKYQPEFHHLSGSWGFINIEQTNFLGCYTLYWHDDEISYVKCKSVFNKEELEKVLEQIKQKNS